MKKRVELTLKEWKMLQKCMVDYYGGDGCAGADEAEIGRLIKRVAEQLDGWKCEYCGATCWSKKEYYAHKELTQGH